MADSGSGSYDEKLKKLNEKTKKSGGQEISKTDTLKFTMKYPSPGGKAGGGVYVSRFPDYSLMYYTGIIKNDPP